MDKSNGKTTKQITKQPSTSKSQVSVKSENGDVTSRSEKDLKNSTASLQIPTDAQVTNGPVSGDEKKKFNGSISKKFSGKSTLVNNAMG